MTHDELYRKIEGLWHDSYKAPGYMMLWNVIKLHKPIEGHEHLCGACWFGDGMMVYPCPTIKAIEKELS